MQCNSINVVEEPVVITRNSHPSEREPARAPQAPNSEPPSAGQLGGHRAGGGCGHATETALCSPCISSLCGLTVHPVLSVCVCPVQRVYFKVPLVCNVVFCFQGNDNKKPFK